jgi:hypothetical protein
MLAERGTWDQSYLHICGRCSFTRALEAKRATLKREEPARQWWHTVRVLADGRQPRVKRDKRGQLRLQR